MRLHNSPDSATTPDVAQPEVKEDESGSSNRLTYERACLDDMFTRRAARVRRNRLSLHREKFFCSIEALFVPPDMRAVLAVYGETRRIGSCCSALAYTHSSDSAPCTPLTPPVSALQQGACVSANRFYNARYRSSESRPNRCLPDLSRQRHSSASSESGNARRRHIDGHAPAQRWST